MVVSFSTFKVAFYCVWLSLFYWKINCLSKLCSFEDIPSTACFEIFYFFHLRSLYMRYVGVVFFLVSFVSLSLTASMPFSSFRKFWVINYSNIDLGLLSLFCSFRSRIPHMIILLVGFPGGSVVKNPPANAEAMGNVGSVPGLRRSPGGGNSNPLQVA